MNTEPNESRQTVMSPPLTPQEAGALLRRKRLALGLTMDQVVARSEVPTRQYVQKLEVGRVDPAKSKYLPSLVSVLGITDAEWADLTGQPRMMTVVDVLHPHRLNAFSRLTEPELLPLGAYQVEDDDSVVILDTTKEMKRPAAGKTYIVSPVAPVQGRRIFHQAMALPTSSGELIFEVEQKALGVDEVRIMGRVLFAGTKLDS